MCFLERTAAFVFQVGGAERICWIGADVGTVMDVMGHAELLAFELRNNPESVRRR